MKTYKSFYDWGKTLKLKEGSPMSVDTEKDLQKVNGLAMKLNPDKPSFGELPKK